MKQQALIGGLNFIHRTFDKSQMLQGQFPQGPGRVKKMSKSI